jgi:hypothetical protein
MECNGMKRSGMEWSAERNGMELSGIEYNNIPFFGFEK